MGEIWQEHRRFILSLVLGGLLFLILWLVLGGIYGSTIKNHRTAIARAKVTQRQARASPVALREAKAARAEEAELFDALVAAVDRVPATGYTLPADVRDPDLHYTEQVDRLRREVLEECVLRNITVDPGLGLPDRFPTTRREKDWYLRGLDVVRQVLELVLEADQSLLLEGAVARVETIRIEAPPAPGPAPFTALVPVSLSIVGHPRGVDYVLRRLTLHESPAEGAGFGRFLSLRTGAVASLDRLPGARGTRGAPADPADLSRVRLDLKVAAVTVNRDGAL